MLPRSLLDLSASPLVPAFDQYSELSAPNCTRSASGNSPQSMNAAGEKSFASAAISQLAHNNYAMPVFGDAAFDESPPMALDDTLLSSLYDPNSMAFWNPLLPVQDSVLELPPFVTSLPKSGHVGVASVQTLPTRPWEAPQVRNDRMTNIRESIVSNEKQRRIFTLVEGWGEVDDDAGRKKREELLAGDVRHSDHPFSLTMLKCYLTSYWVHIHSQMPILHRPTFNPETCPDLLLLAMMCLGATCLNGSHTYEMTQKSAELGFFMAHHIRWDVFKDPEFRPPAKLWTFQAMLLLELFEKMYSTHALHERAHIHHATTLTVMRRGSSLIGRCATDQLGSSDDPTRTPPGPDGSINTCGQNTPDARWNRWITAEATRRVAFAAFIIDATHATLFGHAAVLSPQDLRLPLPCDETLWSAMSSADVQQGEAALTANGYKLITFLEGLRRTLNGQKVNTNTFGRVVLMAGLLNISWHMNQRNLQVSSLVAASTLGNSAKWRSPLTRAFDFWRQDFDDSLSKDEHWLRACDPRFTDSDSSIGALSQAFESRTCLHSLAHMAMHVDIADCLVFAGAHSVLGRLVTGHDRAVVQHQMREQWAPSAHARDATFHALRFLCDVLISPEELQQISTTTSTYPLLPPQLRCTPTFTYSARDDYLLNRPWVVYFALLIVWSYGYALDGPLRPSNYTLSTRALRIFDMQHYLLRMGGVASPDDLEGLKDRNSCLGLLLLVRESLKQPRWELLKGADEVLASCVELLVPGHGEMVEKMGSGYN